MAQQRPVDHPPVVGEDTAPGPLGGVEQLPGALDLLGRRRVRLADHADLVGMQAGGRGEAARGGVDRLGAQAVVIGEIEVDGVDRGLAVRTGGEQHGGAGVAHHLAVGAVLAAGGGAAEVGDEVLPAPHQRDHVRVGGERGRGEDPAGRLAQHQHLRAGDRGDEPVHLGDGAGLGEHHPAGAQRGERGDVGGEVGGGGRVHAHDRAGGVELVRCDGLAGGLLVVGGDGVLEVEDHGVGAGGGLREAVGAVAGAEQQRGADGQRLLGCLLGGSGGSADGAVQGVVSEGHEGSRVCMRVVRAARTTMSPCWSRPVWTRETTDCPGRELESRTSITSVSE